MAADKLLNVVETLEVNIKAIEVWAVIGNFQDLLWHPVVFSIAGEGNNHVNATRHITLRGADGKASSATIDEILITYDAEKMSYSYRIFNGDVKIVPVTNYSSNLSVIPKDSGCIIEWKGAFYRGDQSDNPSEELNDGMAIAAITAIYRAGLEALAMRFSR